MGLAVVSPPAREPIHLDEAKAHLRTLGSTDGDADSLIAGLIRAAREAAETFLGRALITQTFDLVLDEFPSAWTGWLYLPRSPVQAVSALTYMDTAGATQTLSSSLYTLDSVSEPARVYAAYGTPWPYTRDFPRAVTVRFRAGYATPVTVDATANTFTALGRTFTDGDAIELSNSGGALPGGVSEGATYYVVGASGATFGLSLTSGGSAIDLTSAATGTTFVGRVPEAIRQAMKLLIGHWHENRETVITGTIASELPFTVESLLWGERVLRFDA